MYQLEDAMTTSASQQLQCLWSEDGPEIWVHMTSSLSGMCRLSVACVLTFTLHQSVTPGRVCSQDRPMQAAH